MLPYGHQEVLVNIGLAFDIWLAYVACMLLSFHWLRMDQETKDCLDFIDQRLNLIRVDLNEWMSYIKTSTLCLK